MGSKLSGPSARVDRLVVRDMTDEVLIYDLERDRATALNPLAARVWRACDGQSDAPAIAARLSHAGEPVTVEAAWKALDMLGRAHLLDAPVAIPAELRAGRSRREVFGSIGAAAALAVPVVVAISVPAAGVAASCFPDGAGCSAPSQCCSSICISGTCGGTPT